MRKSYFLNVKGCTMNEFDSLWGWVGGNNIRIIQNKEELRWLWKKVAERRPSSLLEIGSFQGGTLYILAHACRPQAKIVAVNCGNEDDQKVLRKVVGRLSGEGYRVDLIEGRSEEVVDKVKELSFRVGAFIIDGDHSYEGVSSDFMLYRDLVAENGIVAFHDIGSWPGVMKFWNELKQKYDTEEIIVPAVFMGIGMVDLSKEKDVFHVSGGNRRPK